MVYVTDTHALIWYLTGDEKIGKSLELHDRILATTAKIHNAILISRDREIRKIKEVKTLW